MVKFSIYLNRRVFVMTPLPLLSYSRGAKNYGSKKCLTVSKPLFILKPFIYRMYLFTKFVSTMPTYKQRRPSINCAFAECWPGYSLFAYSHCKRLCALSCVFLSRVTRACAHDDCSSILFGQSPFLYIANNNRTSKCLF